MTTASRRPLELAVMVAVLAIMWWFMLVARHAPWPWGTPLDVDSPPALHGLIAAGQGWGWHWWAGPWVQGNLAYWRPVASQTWLLEFRLWGSDFESWRWVSYALHLALMLSVWGFLARFTRSRFAGFFMALTMTAVPPGLRWAIGWFPLQTSILSDLGIVLSLWAFVAHLDGGRRRHLYWSLAAFVFAVGCREVAFITPLLVWCVAWARRRPVRVVWPFFATGLALWGYRVAVLPRVPYDVLRWSWSGGDPIRALSTLGGPMGDSLTSLVGGTGLNGGALWSVGFGIMLGLALVLSATRPRRLLPAVLGAWVGGVALAQALCGDWRVGLYAADLLGPAMATAIVVVGAALVFRDHNGRLALAAYAMMVIFYLTVIGREEAYQKYELLTTHAILLGVGVATLHRAFDRTHPRHTFVISWLFAVWFAASALLVAYRPTWWLADNLTLSSLGPFTVLLLLSLAIIRTPRPRVSAADET